MTPTPTPPPTPDPGTTHRNRRPWLPFAIAGGVLVIAGGTTAAVIAASSGSGAPSNDQSHQSRSGHSTTTPTTPPTAPTTADSSAAPPPPAPKTIRLAPSGTCPPYTYQGQQLACHNYDIVLAGFPAGSTQKVKVHSCFGTSACTDRVKLVPVGSDGTGRLPDGIAQAYAGYVITARIGSTGTAVSVS